MSIKETLLNMPVWKVALVTLLMFFVLEAVIEEVLFHPIFKIFDKTMTRMEKMFKDDEKEMENDFKESKAFNEKVDTEWAKINKHEKENNRESWRKIHCDEYIRVQHEKRYFDQIDRNPSSVSLINKSFIESQRNEYLRHQKQVQNDIDDKLFDPSLCKEST